MGVPPFGKKGSPTVRILGPTTEPPAIRARMLLVFDSRDDISNTVVKPQRVNISLSTPESSASLRVSAFNNGGITKCTWLFQKPAVSVAPRTLKIFAPSGILTALAAPTLK